MFLRFALAVLITASLATTAVATPSRIIILRHGEKDNVWALCGVGQLRAEALKEIYLGRDAQKSLFMPGQEPAAFFAITLHSLELAAPAAASWGRPLTLYSVVPETREKRDKDDVEAALNLRTQEAAADLLHDPNWRGKAVVLAWEHKHIASKKLEASYPGETVTLRRLLNLDKLAGVPETWPSGTYDYFWIVDYADQTSDVPTAFSMVKQEFGAPYDTLPENDWGAPNGLTKSSGCDLKGAED